MGKPAGTAAGRLQRRRLDGAVEAWPANDWDDTFTTVLHQPAPVLITSEKVTQPLYVGLGDVMEFQIHLKNTGSLSPGVRITDTLPDYLALTAGPTSNLSPDPVYISSTRTITWSGGVDANQLDATIFFEAKVLYLPPGGTVTNAVWIDDGVHPPLRRQVAASGLWQGYLPTILRESSTGR